MKIFMSQPMAGKSEEEIRLDKERAIQKLKWIFGEFELIDSYIDERPDSGNIGLWYLGKSIILMSEADLVFMIAGWQEARGCRIERLCADSYGIRVLFE